jgi:guanylate kinase
MIKNDKKMKAIIVAAPSGSGKTTLCKYLLDNNKNCTFSISATTRARRNENEQYYFLTVEEFRQKIDNNEFVEWEEVYPGKYYGTLKTEIERIWALGKNIIFDVDVKGGIALKKIFKEDALSIYIQVDLDIIKQRLIKRGSETIESLKIRLEKIELESIFLIDYDTVIFNDNELEKACEQIQNHYEILKIK